MIVAEWSSQEPKAPNHFRLIAWKFEPWFTFVLTVIAGAFSAGVVNVEGATRVDTEASPCDQALIVAGMVDAHRPFKIQNALP